MKRDTSVTADEKNAAEKLIDRIEAEHDARGVLYSILRFCKSGKTTSEIVEQVRKESSGCMLQGTGTLITWLHDQGGLSLISEKENRQVWRVTAEGLETVMKEDSLDKLNNLLKEEDSFRDLYIRILNICITPKTKNEIETFIEPLISEAHADIYPVYFIEALEDAGGIVWNGKWQTTVKGTQLPELTV